MPPMPGAGRYTKRTTYGGTNYGPDSEASRASKRTITYGGKKTSGNSYLDRLRAWMNRGINARRLEGYNPRAGGAGPSYNPRVGGGGRPKGWVGGIEEERFAGRVGSSSGRLKSMKKNFNVTDLNYPSEAEIAMAKMYRPPQVLPSPGFMAPGPQGGGYPGYGGYGYGGGYGGGRGGGPTFQGAGYRPQNQVPRWLQAIANWTGVSGS